MDDRYKRVFATQQQRMMRLQQRTRQRALQGKRIKDALLKTSIVVRERRKRPRSTITDFFNNNNMDNDNNISNDQNNSNNADEDGGSLLVPVRIDLEANGFRLKDAFTWPFRHSATKAHSTDVNNINNHTKNHAANEAFARVLCDDFNVPPDAFVSRIVDAIRKQVDAFNPLADAALRIQSASAHTTTTLTTTTDATADAAELNLDICVAGDSKMEARDQELAYWMNLIPVHLEDPGELRVPIKLNVIVGNVHLEDQFEWDLLAYRHPSEAEHVAAVLCADLGLGGEFITAVAHSIREQLATAVRALLSVRYPFDGSPVLDADVNDLLPSVLNQPVRINEESRDNYTPRLLSLSEYDMASIISAQQHDDERERRRKRRGGKRQRIGDDVARPLIGDTLDLIDAIREPPRSMRTLLHPAPVLTNFYENGDPPDWLVKYLAARSPAASTAAQLAPSSFSSRRYRGRVAAAQAAASISILSQSENASEDVILANPLADSTSLSLPAPRKEKQPPKENITLFVPDDLIPDPLRDQYITLHEKYPDDRFDVVQVLPVDPPLRDPSSYKPDPSQFKKGPTTWTLKIRCRDCYVPGGISGDEKSMRTYAIGPGVTLSNFETHLKNKGHRANVDERIQHGSGGEEEREGGEDVEVKVKEEGSEVKTEVKSE